LNVTAVVSPVPVYCASHDELAVNTEDALSGGGSLLHMFLYLFTCLLPSCHCTFIRTLVTPRRSVIHVTCVYSYNR